MNTMKSSWEDVDRSGAAGHYIHMMDVRNGLESVRRYTRLTYDLLELQSGHAVLDVGCGTGIDALQMAPLVGQDGRVVGMDYSSIMVAEAAARALKASAHNVTFVVGDAHALDFEDGAFDAARAAAVFHHLHDPLKAIQEMKRVVKPGGPVVITEADWGSLMIDHPDRPTTEQIIQYHCDQHQNAWIGRQLPRLFRQCGLRPQTIPAVLIFDQYQMVDLLLGLEKLIASIIETGQLAAADGQQWLETMRQLDSDGELFVALAGFIVTGR